MSTRTGPRKRRFRRAVAATLLGSILAPLLAEACARWLIFSPDPLATALGSSLRDPSALGSADNDERWWYLQRRFAAKGTIAPAPGQHPVLGWDSHVLDPATGRHVDAARTNGRRPVLLYGDSFAQCFAELPTFQGLMERSLLGERYVLINYGIGGYGLDQTCLMMEQTLGKHAAERPIVILSMLVESDLDRTALGFRGWPKPRFTVADGALSGPAPFELDPDRWFEENLPWVHSYALDVATYREGLLGSKLRDRLYERAARIPEKRELSRLLLERAHAVLESHGVEGFVLLFHCRGVLEVKPWVTWQEPLVVETCARLGLPCLDTRTFLLAAAKGDWEAADAFYLLEGPGVGHLNEVGNQIVFEAIREGIEGRARRPDLTRLRTLLDAGVLPRAGPAVRGRTLLGREAWIRSNPDNACLRVGRDFAPLVDTGGLETLLVRGGRVEPCEFLILADGRPHVLSGELSCVWRPGVACRPARVRLTARTGASIVATHELEPGAQPRRIELALDPVETFSLRVESIGPDVECAWACLVGARID